MKRQRTGFLLFAALLAASIASVPPAGAQTVRLPLAEFEQLRHRASFEPDVAAPPIS